MAESVAQSVPLEYHASARLGLAFPGEQKRRGNIVVATGGNAPVIVKYCRNKIVYDKYLLMDGLWAIYQKNK